MNTVYKKQPNFVLGFHGCDESFGEAVLSGKTTLLSSENEYDWLGQGIYFWEGNPLRALQFAQEAKDRPQTTKGKIEIPFVIGAIIDLGVCCNLHDQSTLNELIAVHSLLEVSNKSAGVPMPENQLGADKLKRYLDCAVISYMHAIREAIELPRYQSVRAAFHEGGELYGGSGFTKQSHVQIAVRDEKQILGYFRPR